MWKLKWLFIETQRLLWEMRMGLQGGGRGAQRLEHRNRSSRSWQRVRTQGSWWHIWVPAWRGRHPLCSYGPSPALTLFHQGSDVGYLALMFYGLYVPFVLWSHCNNLFTFVNIYFFKDFRGKEKEKERRMCGCLLCTLYWGHGLQPRHVPWLGIKPVTLWFTALAQSTELHQPELFTFVNI